LTEPDCGTDLQAIRVTARRDGDAYLVNGTKTWISNGIHGSCFAMLVKTDLTAEPRHRGMSMLLAEKGPGFTVSRKLEKLGYKGIDSAELVFQDYRVPADRLIGGWKARAAARSVGLELAAYQRGSPRRRHRAGRWMSRCVTRRFARPSACRSRSTRRSN
jgi:alkylation response protein AidB-like acyl-CoA dehydrogenase